MVVVAPSAAAPPFDDETLRRFDAALDTAAAELGEPLCQQVLGLKGSLARIATRAATQATDEHFALEDRLYQGLEQLQPRRALALFADQALTSANQADLQEGNGELRKTG